MTKDEFKIHGLSIECVDFPGERLRMAAFPSDNRQDIVRVFAQTGVGTANRPEGVEVRIDKEAAQEIVTTLCDFFGLTPEADMLRAVAEAAEQRARQRQLL